MEKYLISLDLDKTILNKKEKLPLITTLGLKRITKQSHLVILNSGRPIQGMIEYIKKLSLYNYPVVASNGGCIYYINRKLKLVKTVPFNMNTKLVNEFFKEIKPFLTYACFQGILKRFYFNEEQVPSFMKHDNKVQDLTITEVIEDFGFNEEIIAISFAVKKEFEEKFEKIKSKKKYSSFSFLFWGGEDTLYYDLQDQTSNKGKAIQYLQKEYKIKTENILSFGDDLNDQSMFEVSGKALLMPNHSLKEPLNYEVIKKDSSHSGVIWYLLKNYFKLF